MKLGVAAAAACLALASCDLPPPTATLDGPHILRILPDPSAGPIDRWTTFRIEVDRRVAPESVPQGVVAITSGDTYAFVDIEIDVVHPALVVTPFDPLDPDVDYQLVVHSFRDLEGHASPDEMTPVVFHVGHRITPPVPSTLTYADVAPTLVRCVPCHAGADAAEGLDLSSPEGLLRTAVDVPSREVAPSVVGAHGAVVDAALIGLRLIESQSASRSYLLYTMVGDEHIAGAPMPPDALVSDDELVQMQTWIRAGVPGLR